MNKLIRIDMRDLTAVVEDTPATLIRLGGRALTSHIIFTEVPPTCHPLGKANKLIFAPGLLAGTGAPNAGRLSIGAKSPLTEGTKEANVGGTAGQKLGRLDIKAIIIEGKPDSDGFYIIKVDPSGAAIIPAPELSGLGNYETTANLQNTYGEKVSILCIGPAGEMGLAAASIASTDPEGRPSRHAARGGLGAVMGSRKVKAIVIDDTGTKVRKADNKAVFQEVCREFTREIQALKSTGLFSQFGTVGGLSYLSKIGALPTRNFTAGSFEGNAQIGGKGVAELNAGRGGSFGHVCMPGCVVRCSNIMHDRNGKFLTAGFEYESSAMLGANLGIDDLDTVMGMEKMCDDLGLDTMEIGVALGVAHDAGIYDFGDGERITDMIREIGQGTVLGRVLGQGAKITARVYGISRVPVVKGQGVPAHDPRKEIGTGIGYATNPQGADHTGVIIFHAENTAEMADISRQKQITTCAYDSMGLCQMAEANLEVMAKLVSSFYGWSWSPEDVADMGKSVLNEEVAFNRSAGLSPATDRLPDFFREEPLSPHEGKFDVPPSQIEKVMDFK
ncbi:aldehyde ferredoxin oxidoreductase [Desulfobacteraceae bacterium SEEP-SAG9]|nr:aldehyde ferredoxin oxidoreductase [Desulfobacteraceae bacterium SEEP-SAG9]